MKLAALAFVALTAALPPAQSTTSPPTAQPRTASPTVLPIEVAVTTASGDAVPGLGQDAFTVGLDGAPAPIASFAGPGQPLTIVALFDVSNSMTNYGDIGDEIERSLVRALRPQDRARIGGIGNRLKLSPRFTSNPRELSRDGRRAVDFEKGERFGPSPLWDAVDEAIRVLAPEPGRRVLILVSDGRGTGNSLSASAVIERAIAAGIVFSGLSDARVQTISQAGDSVARVRAGLMMQELARLTGGLFLPENPPDFGEFPPAGPLLTRLVQDARAMYTIGVAIDAGRKPVRTLAVQVKGDGLTVRVRPALVAPPPPR